jgi:Ni,Fe-hydrogenase III large subunit
VSGRLSRVKIKDPSFHNWQGLSIAVRENDISDFPLCNKSFDLSAPVTICNSKEDKNIPKRGSADPSESNSGGFFNLI